MSDDQPKPYRDTAADYFRAGWQGVLPIRGKWPPPKGWTGTDAAMPSFADVLAWCDGSEGELNVGVRLPAHVLGIDVDDYGDKHGAATLAEHEARLGALPATWISTSRTDSVSGIRLFIVPEGMHWPGVLRGGCVDIIQLRHRYVMVPPSLHPEGRPYQWITPDGRTTADAIPHVADLPNLPQAWIDDLTGGQAAADIERADLGDAQTGTWLAEHGTGTPCEHMVRAASRAEAELLAPNASRHDAAIRATARVMRMIAEGHRGALAALEQVRQAFLRATGGDALRAGEWQRMISGAVRIAAVATVQDLDPCNAGVFGTGSSPLAAQKPSTFAPPTFSPGPLAAPVQSAQAVTAAVEAPSTQPSPFGTPSEAYSAPEAAPAEAEPTSWAPIDLGPILSGQYEDDHPVVLEREDGHALFYLGRVNGLIGPSESGKSWVALEAVRQELEAGWNVVYIDFEDTASGIVKRLRLLGVDPAILLERLAYIGPDEAPGPAQLADLAGALDELAPRLVVLDGFNAAMALSGLDLMSNTDATRFHQGLLKPITREDRALVYVDHTPKNKADESSGGIGAQAKRAMTSGCAIRVDKKDDFGPGVTGYLKLTVDKDRTGLVREFAAMAKYAGEAVIESEHGGPVSIAIQAYDPAEARAQVVEASASANERRVLDLLATHDLPLSKNGIEQAFKGNGMGSGKVREALKSLLAAGRIKVEKGHTADGKAADIVTIVELPGGVFGCSSGARLDEDGENDETCSSARLALRSGRTQDEHSDRSGKHNLVPTSDEDGDCVTDVRKVLKERGEL